MRELYMAFAMGVISGVALGVAILPWSLGYIINFIDEHRTD